MGGQVGKGGRASRRPWSTDVIAIAEELGLSVVRDADGETVGTFNSAADAELAVASVNAGYVTDPLPAERSDP